MSIIPQKRCTKCGIEKPANSEYFPVDKRIKCGLISRCRQCTQKYHEKYYQENSEVIKQRARDWNKDNPGRNVERVRKWKLENPEAYKAKNKAYYQKNRDVIRARVKQWAIDNPDRVKATHREYYLTHKPLWVAAHKKRYALHKGEIIAKVAQWQKDNPERVSIQRKKWAEKNPEKVAAKRQRDKERYPFLPKITKSRRRALEANAEGVHTADDLAALYELQDGHCAYCGITLHSKYHVDHIHPLSRGGSNWPENLALACRDCNLEKGNRMLDYWMKVKGW